MTPDGLIRRISAVEGRQSRLALWGEALRALPPEDAAGSLDRAVRRAALRDSRAWAAFLPLLDLPALKERVGPGRLSAVLLAAREADQEGALLLLEHPGPALGRSQLGPPPDPVLETLSLGHRRAAARGPRKPLLDRILKDPDVRVVAEVLRNPRLRESEVLAIASRRPCPEPVFRLLVRAESWIRRPAVQVALVQNPFAPPQLAAVLTALLADPVLSEVSSERGLHPAVRDGALRVLAWRREVGAPN
jgi:hypothetical protein